MVTLALSSSKSLHTVANSANYEGEHAFETVKIISASEVSGHALKDCTVECHIINPNGDGDIIQLVFIDEDKPEAEFLLSNRYTAVNGNLILFLKIFAEGDVIGLTNEVTVKISKHRAVTSYIADSQLTLLDQYSQTFQKALKAIEDGEVQIDEDKIRQQIEDYLDTHEVVDELTAEDIRILFTEE